MNIFVRFQLTRIYKVKIGYTNSTEVVSSDFIGSRTAGVFDAQATITSGNRLTAMFGMTMKSVIAVRYYVSLSKCVA